MSDIQMTKEELQQALDMLGVKYHHNAKLDTLQQLFNESNTKPEKPEPEEGVDLRAHLLLKRYKITCMNPQKRDWKGEIFTAGNDVSSTVRKFIPYNCPAAQSWHIPAILVDAIRDRKYLQTSLEKDHKGRDVITKQRLDEFILVELPPLSAQELAKLAYHQRLIEAGSREA